MPKSFFVGADLQSTKDDPEFYMRNTVVDVPYGAQGEGLFTASYAQPLTRIKWEVTENALIARLTHERINDADHKGSRLTNDGQVAAMFRIENHFDIRRAYNPQTGEESNVIEENASDRPWSQRQYMRVDWSQNMISDAYELDALSQIGLYGGIKFDPVSYYVSDPTSPDAPVMSPEEGYFDITSKAFATPSMVDTPWGAFPACYFFGSAPAANCNPTELTLRLSFKKIVDHDFEPSEWDGNRQQAFGAFYEERYGYERNYGIVDQKWHKLAAKYNIWERSHISGKVGETEVFAQCGLDYWRDADGEIQNYRTNDKGFVTDGETGLPIPDPAGKPFPGTPAGADPNRDNDGNKTADECEFKSSKGAKLHIGSRCDTIAHRCTLPLHERKLKTIPWYYGPGSPADLYPSTANALNQWNVAVKRAALIGQIVDAKRIDDKSVKFSIGDITEEKLYEDVASALSKNKVDTAPESWTQPKFTNVFVLCHSPVIAGDDPSCGKPGLVARLGDIRYNSVNLINTPQMPSPWGIMVDANDPLTGEKVVTSVNEWVHVLDLATQGTVDLLRWINGEISDADVTSGEYMKDWLRATSTGSKPFRPNTLTQEEIESRIRSIQAPYTFGKSGVDFNKIRSAKDFQKATNQRMAVAAQIGGPSLDSQFEANRQQIIGSKFEAMMVTPELLQAAGYDPQTPVAGDDKVLANASPLRGQHPEMKRWIKRLKDRAMGQHAFCNMEGPEPTSLVGYARLAQKLYPLPDPNSDEKCTYMDASDPTKSVKQKDYAACSHFRNVALQKWLREQFHISVILHEMGHSMALRHNFTGTWDAMNYPPQYWQLRTRNGQEPSCKDVLKPSADGAACAGPRWMDPVTDTEVNGLIWKWASSTVMDYPGDTSQDTNDLGPYDKAFVRFLFANVVDIDPGAKKPSNDTAAASSLPQDEQNGKAYLDMLDGFGGISGPLDFTFGGKYHYTSFQERFNVLGDELKPQSDPSDPLSATYSGPKLDYVSYFDMADAGPGARDPKFAIDPEGRVRHPYMFGSDEYADSGNMPVFRFDSGADAYEQMQFIISTYENRYIFDNFRRNKVMFTSGGVIGRIASRTFDKMTTATKALALYGSLYPEYIDASDPASAQLTAKVGYMLGHALASSDSLAAFARILTRPEPGDYYDAGDGSATVDSFGSTAPPVFRVPVGSGEGRYLHNDYDYSQGYTYSSYQTQVGSYYEKIASIYYLTEAYNHFIQNSKDDYIDGRFLNLNYASLYPEQMRRLFSNILQDDQTSYSPYVAVTSGQLAGDIKVAQVGYFPWEKYDAKTGTTSLAYPPGATRISPLVGWEEQYPTLIYSFMYGATTLTMDWVQQMRIFTPGGGEAVTIPADQQVRYEDPLTGILYVARDYGSENVNGQSVYRSIGARMLQYANRAAAANFVHTGTNDQPVWTRDPDTNEARCVSVGACVASKAKVRRFSANIDTLRQLSFHMGYGPIGRE